MKHAITSIAMLFATGVTLAQEFTHSLSGVEWVRIESKARLKITAANSGSLRITGGVPANAPEKAKGLKLVGEGGTDNTGAGFYMLEEGSTLILRNLNKSDDLTEITLPASQNVSVVAKGLNDVELMGFTGEVEVKAPVTGNILLRDVTGPVTAESNTGKVEIVFNTVSQASPISVSSATGDMDITLPAGTPASLELESTMGNIYTNFDISTPEKDGLKAVSSQNIKGDINRGGVAIRLSSATGNIYLRKK